MSVKGKKAIQPLEHNEKMEALRAVIIGQCYEARDAAPCGCGLLEKGQVTQEVLDKVQMVIDEWTMVRENLKSLGCNGEE
jgi:hypothetical protein